MPDKSEIIGRAGSENFKVASRLLPRGTRQHLLALYGYARLVDYMGDEFAGDRLAGLDWLESEVTVALVEAHAAGGRPPPGGHGVGAAGMIGEVARSVVELNLDSRALFDLIQANRLDQAVRSYATFADLVGYCRLSANPVGRLVLGAFGCTDPERIAWSDSICTGLQLAEHWQDVAEDVAAGRVYIPTEDLARFDLAARDLEPGGALGGPRGRALMAFEVARARRLLDHGRPLIGHLHGSARWAVIGFWAGGHTALDGIARRDFDVRSGPVGTSRLGLVRRLVDAGRGLA